MKLLVVEDDPTTRVVLAQMVSDLHHEITLCEDAETAFEAYQAQQHELLLVDWMLPGMDGLELCRRVRDCESGDLSVILIVTAHDQAVGLHDVLDAGADDFLAKPLDAAQLTARLTIAEGRYGTRVWRKQAGQALMRSEQRYRRLIDAVTDYIFTVRVENGQPVETQHSPACVAVTGYTPEEFAANPYLWIQMVHEDDRDAVRHQAARLLAGEDTEPLEHRIIRRDGAVRWIGNTLVPNIDAQGHLVSYDGLLRDITERREAEEQRRRLEEHVQRAQKLESLGVLAGGIAHDFNNILAAILGYTGLAIDELPQDSPARDPLAQVLQSTNRAKDLVKEILAFSRQEDLERRPLSFAKLLRQVLKMLRATLPTTIDIQRQITKEPTTVLANATQLRRVIVNLCANASHAMREHGGVLTLTLDAAHFDGATAPPAPAMEPGDYVQLTVSDTGPGIEPGIIGRIFEPFFTTKEVGEGTGMGLAMVHGIVTGHGGHITVDSEPGRGAAFHVYLPRVDAPAAPDLKPEETEAAGNEHILFVDDEEVLAYLGKQALERLGYRVTATSDSREALDAFRADPAAFDVVVTDQTMPDLTGDALARELRRIRPDIPIILTTGFSEVLTEEKAKEIGIRAILNKPVPSTELAQTIRSVLAMPHDARS